MGPCMPSRASGSKQQQTLWEDSLGILGLLFLVHIKGVRLSCIIVVWIIEQILDPHENHCNCDRWLPALRIDDTEAHLQALASSKIL